MNREKIASKIEALSTKSKQDDLFIRMLRNKDYPDFSIEQYMEIKADYTKSLYERGIL